MQSKVAQSFETGEGHSPFTLPVRVLPFSPSASEPKEVWLKSALTTARVEEAVGVAFMAATLSLTGWFYYMLYQALQG